MGQKKKTKTPKAGFFFWCYEINISSTNFFLTFLHWRNNASGISTYNKCSSKNSKRRTSLTWSLSTNGIKIYNPAVITLWCFALCHLTCIVLSFQVDIVICIFALLTYFVINWNNKIMQFWYISKDQMGTIIKII